MTATDEPYLEVPDRAVASGGEGTDRAPGYLEVRDRDGGSAAVRSSATPAPAKQVTVDPTRIVSALAQEELPLLAALYPGQAQLLRALPDAEGLATRITYVNGVLNQITRRSGEWRARAEIAGTELSRRLVRLGADPRVPLHMAAAEELRRWIQRGFEEQVIAAAGREGVLYARDARRLRDEALSRGLEATELDTVCSRLRVQTLTDDVPMGSELSALPGAPRDLDGVADALVRAPSQGIVAIREGSVLHWLQANHAREDMLAASRAAQDLTRNEAHAVLGVWAQVWALGRTDVSVGGHRVDSPEALLAAMRAARVHESQLQAAAPVLAAWFRRFGQEAGALACEGLAAGDPHGVDRLRWSLGEPFRLAGRTVTDAPGLSREVLTRDTARQAALALYREGTLVAWLESLAPARRDVRWLDDLNRASGTPSADERPFWRGIYRHAPRAPLRVSLGGGRYVKFATAADLLGTPQVAAVWEPLKGLYASGELLAWLEHTVPDLDLDVGARATAEEDRELNELLWRMGHQGCVLAWGRSGLGLASPRDVVAAYQQAWQKLEAQLARGSVVDWLRRFHGSVRLAGGTLAEEVDALERVPSGGGFRALALALACGLEYLPLDPKAPRDAATVRGYVGIEPGQPDEGTWEKLSTHVEAGTALRWARRHAREVAHVPLEADAEAVRAALDTTGRWIPSHALLDDARATELFKQREAEREIALHEAERLEAAARVATARAMEREAERLAAEREVERLTAAARVASALATERLEAERAAERVALARRMAEREVGRMAAAREAERVAALREAERIAAEREHDRVDAEREAERLASEREAAERDAQDAALARRAAERDAERLMGERAAAEREAERYGVERLTAEREAARWAAERASVERFAAEKAREAEKLAATRLASDLASTGDEALPPGMTVEHDDARAEAGEAPNADDVANAGLAVFEAGAQGVDDAGWAPPPDDSPYILPERHELESDLLLEAARVTDEAQIARIRAAVNAWAATLGDHPYRDLGDRMEPVEIVASPAFSVVLHTRLERRRTEFVHPPWPATETVSLAGAREGTADPWLAQLPDVDTYALWRATYVVDGTEVRGACDRCHAKGRVACAVCEGGGTESCAVCHGAGRLRCAPCAGTGETARGRCERCEGRGEAKCEHCRFGWAMCSACHGAKDCECPACGGSREQVERLAVIQEYDPVAGMGFVAGALPSVLTDQARTEALSPVPVAFIEGGEIDAFELAREIPNAPLAGFVAELVTAENHRAPRGARVTRQRLIVRRYPAFRVAYRLEGRSYELWVHGPREQVHAEQTPVEGYASSLLAEARAALAAERYESCADALTRLHDLAPEHVEGEAVATSLAEAILAMAQRGELLVSRDLASRAASLRWPGARSVLLDAEKVLGARLGKRSAWVLLEQARTAMAAQRFDRATDALAELSRTEGDHPEARALLPRLTDGMRASVAASRWFEARALAARVARIDWPETRRAADEIDAAITAGVWREARARFAGRAFAAAVLACVLAAVLARASGAIVAAVLLALADTAGIRWLEARARKATEANPLARDGWLAAVAPAVVAVIAALIVRIVRG